MSLSNEQQVIIDYVKNNQNVVCMAVAGAGKTTTILSLAEQMPNYEILQITYNRQLRNEVDMKKNQRCLFNMQIKTYHQIANNYYDDLVKNDEGIIKVLNENKPLKFRLTYNIIVIDETQDQTPLLKQMVQKFIYDITNDNIAENFIQLDDICGLDIPISREIKIDKVPKIQLVILGDHKQAIYEFKGADCRFLSLAPALWKSCYKWGIATMKTSYRMTRQIAAFINDISDVGVVATRDGPPVDFILGSPFCAIQNIYDTIKTEIDNCKITPGEIFILLPSIKSRSEKIPFKQLENKLVKSGIKCHVPISDDAEITDDIIRGKVVFSNFHQSKGRERRLVVVMNFDASYFKFYARDEPQMICPPALYVALTRAQHKLIVCADHEKLSFCPDYEVLAQMKNINFIKNYKGNYPNKFDGLLRRNITDLIKFIRTEQIIEINAILTGMIYCNCHKKWPCPAEENDNNIATIYQNEFVGDITSMAMSVLLYRLRENKEITAGLENNTNPILRDKYIESQSMPFPQELLCKANIYIAHLNGLLHKVAQLKDYNWLTIDDCKILITNINKIGKIRGIEVPLGVKRGSETYLKYDRYKIYGRCDIIDENTLWEIKCVRSLTIEHILQLVCYMFMLLTVVPDCDLKFKVFNIKTGLIYEIKPNYEKSKKIMNILLSYNKINKLNDHEFIKNNC